MTGWHNRVAFPACPAVVATLAMLVAGAGSSRAAEFPYAGVVLGEKVEVRAGGGDSFYSVGTLKQGTFVEVHGHFYGWFKIKPPEGVFGYVKRAFINRHGAGNEGTVSGKKAMVWAAQVEGPPGASFRQQRFLAEGERVVIVDQAGDYYRIVPPSETFVFLSPGSLERATEEQLKGMDHAKAADPEELKVEDTSEGAVAEPSSSAAEVDATPATPAMESDEALATEPTPVASTAADDEEKGSPAGDSDVLPETAAPKTDDVAADVGEDNSGPAPMVEAAEMRLNAVSGLPLSSQPIGELIATYQALQDTPDLRQHDRSLVSRRLKQLANRQRLASTLRSVSKFRSDLKHRSGNASDAYEAQLKEGYAAVGWLLASIVYNGETLPVMYRVVEPGTYRTLAYVRPATRAQATRLLGRLVGVVGRSRYDRALKALVVEADRLELLEPALDHETRSGSVDGEMVLVPAVSDGR